MPKLTAKEGETADSASALLPDSQAPLVRTWFYDAETGEGEIIDWPNDCSNKPPKGFSQFPKPAK